MLKWGCVPRTKWMREVAVLRLKHWVWLHSLFCTKPCSLRPCSKPSTWGSFCVPWEFISLVNQWFSTRFLSVSMVKILKLSIPFTFQPFRFNTDWIKLQEHSVELSIQPCHSTPDKYNFNSYLIILISGSSLLPFECAPRSVLHWARQ